MALMKTDFPDIEQIKTLINCSTYMVLNTCSADGWPSLPTPVYFRQGHSLSFYWLSEVDSQHSKNIAANDRVSGVILDTRQLQGEGYAFYFRGPAESFNDNAIRSKSPLPPDYDEKETMIRALCDASNTLRGKEKLIDDPSSSKILFRVTLQQAWMNGGVYKNGEFLERNSRVEIPIHVDRAAPVRRFFGEPVIAA